MEIIDQDAWIAMGLDRRAWSEDACREIFRVYIDKRVYQFQPRNFIPPRVITNIRHNIYANTFLDEIGSFRTRDEAETVVAKMILYGVEYITI